METKGFLFRLIFAVMILAFMAGCTKTAVLPSGKNAEWNVVIIGDSSLWEHGQAIASQVEKDLGVKATLEDFTLPNLQASSVLEVFETEKSPNSRLEKLPAAVREAEVVVMFTNPLGSVDPQNPHDLEACFYTTRPENCSTDSFKPYSEDLKAIWAKIIELRKGNETILIATDIYNPIVSVWDEAGILDDCSACWVFMSAAAREAADAYNIPFVSRFAAFNGVDHKADPRDKGLIASDGEHPTALMGEEFAKMLAELGYQPYKVKK